MTDLDTTIKKLINSAVDAELAGHRVAPPFRQGAQPERRRPAGWVAPLLAAVVAALVALGSVVVVGDSRLHPSDRRTANRAGASGGNSATPGAISATALGRGVVTRPDPQVAARAYDRVAAIAPEATVAAGVQVDPVRSAPVPGGSDLVTNFSLPSLLTPGPTITLPPGLVPDGPGKAAVLSLLFDSSDDGVGTCPGPFLVRPHHTYLITCAMTSHATGATRFSLSLQTPTAHWQYDYALPPT